MKKFVDTFIGGAVVKAKTEKCLVPFLFTIMSSISLEARSYVLSSVCFIKQCCQTHVLYRGVLFAKLSEKSRNPVEFASKHLKEYLGGAMGPFATPRPPPYTGNPVNFSAQLLTLYKYLICVLILESIVQNII